MTMGVRKSNVLGITPGTRIRTKFGRHAHTKERQRSGKFGCNRLSGGKMGVRTNPPLPVFLSSKRDDILSTLQPPIFLKFAQRESTTPRKCRNKYSKIFYFGSFAIKTSKLNVVKQVPQSDQLYSSVNALQRDRLTVHFTL